MICLWCNLPMFMHQRAERICNVRRSAENRNHHLPCEAPMPDDKSKTVVPPTRGRGGPHPAEVNEHLGLAHTLCGRLIEAAEYRNDQAGADAWLTALRAIEFAETAMREAREQQTWRTMQGQRVASTLAARARADSDPLGRTAERDRVCDQGTTGCSGRGEKHACISDTADRERVSLARLVVMRTKHGPGGTGASGPCDENCLKCMAEGVIKAGG